MRNQLHYGDNLTVLREKIPDEVADAGCPPAPCSLPRRGTANTQFARRPAWA